MDSGCGNPRTLDPLDVGCGAGSPSGADLRAGSPALTADGLYLVPMGGVSSHAPPAGWLGSFADYGGGQIALLDLGGELPFGTYTVRLVGADGSTYPEELPGLSWPGQKTALQPKRGALRFVLPPLPLGNYTVRVWMPSGEVVDLPRAVRVVWGNLPRDFDTLLALVGREFVGRS